MENNRIITQLQVYLTKKWKKIGFGILALILLVAVKSKIPIYEWDYLGKLGFPIWSDYRWEKNVKKIFGEPFYYQEDHSGRKLVYDKFNFCNGPLWGYIEVTDDSVKFGSQKIGIGSTREEVEKAYCGLPRIDEYNFEWNKSNYGIIDGIVKRVWVEFTFDSENLVEEIVIYNGP